MSARPVYILIDFHNISGRGTSPAYGLEVMASKGHEQNAIHKHTRTTQFQKRVKSLIHKT